MAGGGAAGGGIGLAAGLGAMATGRGLRVAANKMTAKELRKLDEMTRKRSPLYERLMQDVPMDAPPALRRAAMNRALLLMSQQSQGAGGIMNDPNRL